MLFRWNFDNVFAFGASRFISSEMLAFILDFVMSVTIQGFPISTILPALLKASDSLGRHTSIIHLHQDKFSEYRWKHPTLAPNCQVLPLQCKVCGRLQSFGQAKVSNTVTVFHCTGVDDPDVDGGTKCSGEVVFEVMPGFTDMKVHLPQVRWMMSHLDEVALKSAVS
jgi:hypothetical protein